MGVNNSRGRFVYKGPFIVMATGGNIDSGQLAPIDPRIYCTTELHTAVEKGHVDMADRLIRRGVDVNGYDINGNTPLILAVNQAGRIRPLNSLMFDQLLKNSDADLIRYVAEYCSIDNKTETKAKAIPESTQRHCDPHATVDLLLKSEAEIDKARSDGITPLHLAVLAEELMITEKLLKAGANLEARNSDGMTPLLLASVKGNFKEIELLKQSGANMSAVDNRGRNALLLLVSTASCSEERTVKLLADNSDQIDVQDKDGFTPLMNAAYHLDLNTVKVLLELGADPNVVATPSEFTVLGIFLDNTFLHRIDVYLPLVEQLIQLGALHSLHQRYYNVLLQLVMAEPKRFVKMMITNGLVPMSRYYTCIGYKEGKLSPFGAALMRNNLNVAQYMKDHWFFTTDDLVGSKNLNSLKDFLVKIRKPKSVRYLQEFKSQPMTLIQLSFTTVSSQLGAMVGREERVRQLPVPKVVQDKLLFLNKEDSTKAPAESEAVSVEDEDEESPLASFYNSDSDDSHSELTGWPLM